MLIPSLGHRAEEFLASGQTTKTACLVWYGRMPCMDGPELQCRLAGSDRLIDNRVHHHPGQQGGAATATPGGSGRAFLRSSLTVSPCSAYSVRFSKGRSAVEKTVMTTDLVDPVDRCARRVTVPGGAVVVDGYRSALRGLDPFALARGDSGILETRSEDGEESLSIPDHPAKEVAAEDLVGSCPALRAVFSPLPVAQRDSTVLITGETGTGKQLIARAIHRPSPRSGHSIVGVNCAETPASLSTTRSFGHERGAFTSPLQRPPGHFELAAWRDAIPRQGRAGKHPTERLKRDHGRLRPAAVRDC